MSDLLNSASLVMIPSGYKEDIVYSAVPTDGSGDLSFTRASNATRINSAGLVEVCPWNLLLDTDTFSSWSLEGGTLTSGFTDPNGGSTAYKYVQVPGGGLYSGNIGVTADVKLAQIWIKSVSGGSITCNISDGAAFFGTFNVTGTWQLFTAPYTANTRIGLYLYSISNASGIYVWHPQINIGSTAKPYFPTTDRLNVPRLTYQNGGGGCPSLLLEKQSTNLVQYSENLAASSWTTADNTRTANYATSPDGTTNATRIIPNTNNAAHPTYQVIVVSAATSITAYAKADGYNFFQIYGGEASGVSGSSARFSVVVNLSTFAVDTIDTISSSQVNISNMGNGWAKITINNFTQFTSGNYFLAVAAIPSSGLSRNSVLDIGFAGNGASGVLTYGIQVEQSSYATSYIPTTSSSATRVADACFKTGISSLIGQTEGTIFLDVQDLAQETFLFSFNESTSSSVSILKNSSNEIQCQVWGSVLVTIFSSAVSNIRLKIAFAYKSGSVAVYINGVQAGTSATTFTLGTTMDTIYLPYRGTYYAISQTALYNQLALFKTRLTNAELASLTTI